MPALKRPPLQALQKAQPILTSPHSNLYTAKAAPLALALALADAKALTPKPVTAHEDSAFGVCMERIMLEL
ncbi:hypothetical protein D9615_003161 [Tricholomella constricta]|uniref:Uncharacterized protein n=1 Tax=Tricholomella constricta TaxID=117010 RepID=A0A8H5M828_9AGAR|nr:hypothetical protein D9615_003161 [Tricholomella constricta]